MPSTTSADDAAQLRSDRWAALAVFVLTAAVYLGTMCRTIYTGDDGDFLTAIVTCGIPHPTGYPLFCLLGKLFFALEPLGTYAFRINLLTALIGAGASAMLFRVLALLVRPRFWAACGALLFAFGPTMWQQCLSCEVYALTCFFLTTLLYLAACWHNEPTNDRLLYTLAGVYGLALTNHLTTALYLPGFLVFVFARRRTLWREGRVFGQLALCFLAPLALYAYLPLSAAHNPPVAWGDPSTVKAFWDHITGAAFHGRMFRSGAAAWQNLGHYGIYADNEIGLFLAWLIPLGAWSLWKRGGTARALCALLLSVALADIAYAINYDIFDIYVYYLPSYLTAFSLVAAGASECADLLCRGMERWRGENTEASSPARRPLTALLAPVALLIPLIQMSAHWSEADQHGNYLEEDFSANILRSAPRGALVVVSSNAAMSLWYQRFCLNERTDAVTVWRQMAAAPMEWNAWYYKHLSAQTPLAALAEREVEATQAVTERVTVGGVTLPIPLTDRFLLALLDNAARNGTPIFLLPDDRYDGKRPGEGRFASLNDELDSRFQRIPWGLGERLIPKSVSLPPLNTVLTANESLWDSFTTRGLWDNSVWARADEFQSHIPRRYAQAVFTLGQMEEKAGRRDRAADAYRRTLALLPAPEVQAALARVEPETPQTHNIAVE